MPCEGECSLLCTFLCKAMFEGEQNSASGGQRGGQVPEGLQRCIGGRGEGVWCGCGVGRYHQQCNTASGGKLKGGAEKGRVVGRQVPQGVP